MNRAKTGNKLSTDFMDFHAAKRALARGVSAVLPGLQNAPEGLLSVKDSPLVGKRQKEPAYYKLPLSL